MSAVSGWWNPRKRFTVLTFSCLEHGVKDLGMFSGEIDDSALSASSTFDPKNVGPHNARLVSANRTSPSISCPDPRTGGADVGIVKLAPSRVLRKDDSFTSLTV